MRDFDLKKILAIAIAGGILLGLAIGILDIKRSMLALVIGAGLVGMISGMMGSGALKNSD